VFHGVVVPDCTPVSPASRWLERRITCTPYDPADARRLVAASGVAHPTLHVVVGPGSDDRRLAEFIQAQEAAVGIEVVIDPARGDETETGHFEARLANWAGAMTLTATSTGSWPPTDRGTTPATRTHASTSSCAMRERR